MEISTDVEEQLVPMDLSNKSKIKQETKTRDERPRSVQKLVMLPYASSNNKLTSEEKYERMRKSNNVASKKFRQNQKEKNEKLVDQIANLEIIQKKLKEKEKNMIQERDKLRANLPHRPAFFCIINNESSKRYRRQRNQKQLEDENNMRN